jgi:hypothetical protein
VLQLLSALLVAFQAPGLKLEGRVVDERGAPQPAHVVIGSQAESYSPSYELLCAAVAGADGRFALELPRAWIDRTVGYRPLEVFAYLEGHGIAAQSWELADVPAGTLFELRMPRAASMRVRFVDPEGRPVVSARAWPQGLADGERGVFSMPAAWWRDHAAITDEEGWATLPVASEDLAQIGLEGEGLGYQLFGRDLRELVKPLPSELEVLLPVRRELAIEGPLPWGAVVTVESHRTFEADERYGTGWAKYEWQLVIGASAPLSALLTRERPMVRLATRDASALAFGNLQWSADGGPLKLSRSSTYRVSGRAVDKLTGAPVSGAEIQVRTGMQVGWVMSGSDGRFAFDCGAPGFAAEFLRAPAGYASEQSFLSLFQGQRPEDGSDLEVGDVPVTPAWTATGKVLGADGQPVAGAWITCRLEIPAPFGTGWVSLSTLTDETGHYELRGVHVGVPLEIVVRKGDDRAKVAQAPGEPLEIALAPALRAVGIARDPSGAGVPDLELEVWRASPPNVSGGEELVVLAGSRSFRTAADGSFRSAGGLEKEVSYCLAWSDPRFGSGRSAWFAGDDLASGVGLALTPRSGLRGKLTAADGTPLAGVELRLRRNARSTVTAADGTFELDGLADSGDVLIAKSPSGGRQVLWVTPSGTPLAWRLASVEDLERPLAPAQPPERARELAIAVALLEADFQAALESKDEGTLLRSVERLAWADPALVLDRVEAGLFATPWMRDFALTYVADALRHQAPEEALAVGARLERGMSRALSALKSAELLAPAAEHEQLALVRAEARAIDPPEHRAVVLARLADRLLDLGEQEAALDVLAEARPLAEALPREDWPGYARSCVGEVLARVDLAAGRALIDGLADVDDRGRHVFNTAHELAASDPAACEALMKEQATKPGSWRPQRYIARIAHRMAPADLERARDLASLYDRTGFADGMIALALADSDPAEARASLDLAYVRAEQCSQSGTEFDERPLAVAGALLPVAERVDPANLRRYVARAVALRPREVPERFGSEHLTWREDAALAFYLARWEPELAQRLIGPAVDAARKLRGKEVRYEHDALWAALAAVDPERAAEVSREVGGRAAAVVGRVLAMPLEQRTTYVQDEIFELWILGKEDI